MSKLNIVGINGSPRKNGNSATLLKWVLAGCAEAGAGVELIQISDYDIQYCQGCNRCLREGACPIDDDYLLLFRKMMAADGIVVASPVYADAPTAQLKTLMDRMTLLNLFGATFQNKLSVGLATSGVAPTKNVARRIADMFGCRCGFLGATTATLKGGYQPLELVHKPDLPEKANRLGKKLVYRLGKRKGKEVFTMKRIWISFLRKHLLSKMVTRFPEEFKSAIELQPGIYSVKNKH